MKYTIELTDAEYNILTGFMNMINSEIQTYYFQETELEPAEKTWEDELEKAKLFAYRDGFEHGKLWATEEYTKNRQGYYNDGYNNALDDANHALTVLENMTETEREEWFEDYASVGEVIHECTIQRIIKSTKEYEEKKTAEKEIKVGDEVTIGDGDTKAIATRIEDKCIRVLYSDGTGGLFSISDNALHKTGQNFNNVLLQLLDKLKGEK